MVFNERASALLVVVGAVVVASASSSIQTVQAACNADVNLCEAETQVITTNLCMDQDLKWTMPSCCSKDSIKANECPRDPQPTCRYVELKTPFADSKDACCADLALTFDWSLPASTCCKTCSCFGDPHCISFDDQVDSWILCDGRVKNPSAVYGQELFCPIKEKACTQQLDHKGNKCVYKDNGLGSVGFDGSPCQSVSSDPASIVMYKTADFELVLYLGDRGIITSIKLTNGNEVYYTKAGACASSGTPWRDSPDAKNPPNDPNWLPYSWKYDKVNQGQGWHINGLKTGIEIDMRCIFNRDNTLPRINIAALSDPVNNRPGSSGVCVTGQIDKQLSTWQHTEEVKKFCRSKQSQGQAIEYFCGLSWLNNPNGCIRQLCSRLGSNADEQKACFQNIIKYQTDDKFKDGWERVWCAFNTLASNDPAQCTAGPCLQCMYDVYDFTWEEAVSKWKDYKNGGSGTGGTVSGPCIPLSQLNATLGDCQNGITFQYLDLSGVDENGDQTECWVDFLSIPEGRNICGGNLIPISSLTASDKAGSLFDSQIRIKQCNNQAICSSSTPNECTPEYGVSGSIKLVPDPVTNKANLYWQLVRQGKLVCASSDPNCLTKAYGAQLETAKCYGCQYCPTS